MPVVRAVPLRAHNQVKVSGTKATGQRPNEGEPGMKAARYGDADHRLTSSGKAVTQRHHLRLWCTVSSVVGFWRRFHNHRGTEKCRLGLL